MCKIFIATGIKKENRDTYRDLIEQMAFEMSSGSDRDGLGYAALTEKGELFGERWVNNDDAFDVRSEFNSPTTLETEYRDFMEYETPLDSMIRKYGSFGLGEDGLEEIAAITLHTRFATTEKGFTNCHPFVSKDRKTSLIHNGVISNQHSLTNLTSTNDSECILNEYTKFDVRNNPSHIQKVADKLEGWYACGVFSEGNDGVKFLDIFKESMAKLNGVYIKELGGVIFCTDIAHITNACAALQLTIERVYKVKPGMLIRINPFTGKPILKESFKESESFGYPYTRHTQEYPVGSNYRNYSQGGDDDTDAYNSWNRRWTNQRTDMKDLEYDNTSGKWVRKSNGIEPEDDETNLTESQQALLTKDYLNSVNEKVKAVSIDKIDARLLENGWEKTENGTWKRKAKKC